jgi:hypothetical protein
MLHPLSHIRDGQCQASSGGLTIIPRDAIHQPISDAVTGVGVSTDHHRRDVATQAKVSLTPGQASSG